MKTITNEKVDKTTNKIMNRIRVVENSYYLGHEFDDKIHTIIHDELTAQKSVMLTYDDTRDIAIKCINKLIDSQLIASLTADEHNFEIQDLIHDEINEVLGITGLDIYDNDDDKVNGYTNIQTYRLCLVLDNTEYWSEDILQTFFRLVREDEFKAKDINVINWNEVIKRYSDDLIETHIHHHDEIEAKICNQCKGKNTHSIDDFGFCKHCLASL